MKQSTAINKKFKTFCNLKTRQLGIELIKKVYTITNNHPQNKQLILITQPRLSAISIPSNIAEGSRRNFSVELHHFFNISLAELETQIIVAHELRNIREDAQSNFLENIDQISRKTSNPLKILRHNAKHLTHNKG